MAMSVAVAVDICPRHAVDNGIPWKSIRVMSSDLLPLDMAIKNLCDVLNACQLPLPPLKKDRPWSCPLTVPFSTLDITTIDE
jgi:hypothetical protein